MTMSYRAAAIQFEPTLFAMEHNIERLVALTEEAASNGARLIVHPEMGTTGYCWASRAEIAPYVETIPGPTTARFAEIAARHGCYIVAGIAEVVPATNVYYNSAALVGPDGLIGVYRKAHSYISEPKWAKDGDLGFPVFDTELGRIGIAICMDAAFPESFRVPALAGADVIAFPTNWLWEKCPSATWLARAAECGVYVIAANRWGLERGVQFSGGSCVIDPSGYPLSIHDTGDGIAYGTIDLGKARDKRWVGGNGEDKLADRRPELYGDITLSTYRWQDRDFHGLYGIDPLPAGKQSRVVVSQWTPGSDFDANLAHIAATCKTHAGADLIVFPELALTGPVDATSAEPAARPANDEPAVQLASLASAHAVHMVVGFVEQGDGVLHNSAVVVGPDGVIGVARKTHLTAADRTWATAGERLSWFDLPAGRTGVLIGYDATFPEACICLALWGADLLACPSMVEGPPIQPLGPTVIPLGQQAMTGHSDAHFHLWRERAREGNVVVAFANVASPAMGWSGIFGGSVEEDPADESIVPGDAPGVATYEMDTRDTDGRYKTNPLRAKDVVSMRMPIWYDSLQSTVLVSDAGDD